MKFFYLSSECNSEGKFEIHERDCELIPSPYVRDYLGPFNSGNEALSKALNTKSDSVLCAKCSSASNVYHINSFKLERE
ncbi:MAG: hypothetical protein ACI8YP_001059 [Algoriphagus sp.]|jgi:hypothetical protein